MKRLALLFLGLLVVVLLLHFHPEWTAHVATLGSGIGAMPFAGISKRDLNSVLLATIETTEGVPQAATNSTDVVLIENLTINYNESQQTTQEVTGTLDPNSDIPIGGACSITFDTWLKGNGTAGTAPEIGKLFKACGWSETVTSSQVTGTIVGTCGGNFVTVSNTNFTGANESYRGMIALLSGNPSTAIYTSIMDWTTPVFTFGETFSPILSTSTVLTIPKNVLYSPISPPTAIPSLTLRAFKDGVLTTVAGCRGTHKAVWDAGKGIKLSWTLSGIMQEPRTDSANPTNPSPDSPSVKLRWRNDSNNGAFVFNGSRIGVLQHNFDNGVAVDNAPNPNQPSGYDVADLGSRVMKGDINPRLASIATRDNLALKRAGGTVTLEMMAMNSVGNGVMFSIPAAEFTAYSLEKQGPMIGEKLPYKATGPNAGAFYCFF